MKPQPVDLRGVTGIEEVVERILETRLREVRSLTAELQQRDKQGLHDLRIACKRLRYALERFEPLDPSLDSAVERLSLLQDALGEVHDRDVLLDILPSTMGATQRRLQDDREIHIDRAVALWDEVQSITEAIDSHPI